MADRIRWGILATGGIARQFAAGLPTSKTGSLQAVGSRTLETATAFAKEYGGKPYASYDEVLSDSEVDAVYIATPHHLHAEWTIKAARAGKAILCEKPFTLNATEAEQAIAAVREAGVFFMEAFMYRVHPQTLKIKELVRSGAIGRPLVVNAEFGFAASRDWTNFRADGALGGGGLMDVGTYCTTFASMVAGEEAVEACYQAEITAKGYDAFGSGSLKYPSGMAAAFSTGIHAELTNDARIYGEEGSIHVPSPWKCSGGNVILKRKGKENETFEFSTTNDELYGMEADAVAASLETGECPHMTIAETLANMRTLDRLKASAGLVFRTDAAT